VANGVKQAAKVLAAATSFATDGFFAGSPAIAEVPNATMMADIRWTLMSGFRPGEHA
jgi:hypothetical protein